MLRVPPSDSGAAPTVSKERGLPYSAACAEVLNSHSQYSEEMEGLVATKDFAENAEDCDAEPLERTGNERRSPRIPCRNMMACVKTPFTTAVVNVPNISRKGLCFRSAKKFWQGAAVSIATYYIEGGQNIFQNARIVRTRNSPSGTITEYGVEF